MYINSLFTIRYSFLKIKHCTKCHSLELNKVFDRSDSTLQARVIPRSKTMQRKEEMINEEGARKVFDVRFCGVWMCVWCISSSDSLPKRKEAREEVLKRHNSELKARNGWTNLNSISLRHSS